MTDRGREAVERAFRFKIDPFPSGVNWHKYSQVFLAEAGAVLPGPKRLERSGSVRATGTMIRKRLSGCHPMGSNPTIRTLKGLKRRGLVRVVPLNGRERQTGYRLTKLGVFVALQLRRYPSLGRLSWRGTLNLESGTDFRSGPPKLGRLTVALPLKCKFIKGLASRARCAEACRICLNSRRICASGTGSMMYKSRREDGRQIEVLANACVNASKLLEIGMQKWCYMVTKTSGRGTATVSDDWQSTKRKRIPLAALAVHPEMNEAQKPWMACDPQPAPVFRLGLDTTLEKLVGKPETGWRLALGKNRPVAAPPRKDERFLESACRPGKKCFKLGPFGCNILEEMSAEAILRVAARHEVEKNPPGDPKQFVATGGQADS
ncbi:MAG: hypothetical protein N3G20_02025 [Verrucomicrobiae bacterium]|nr:hypothetical protein [Verrucomicrobiae bacterium]